MDSFTTAKKIEDVVLPPVNEDGGYRLERQLRRLQGGRVPPHHQRGRRHRLQRELRYCLNSIAQLYCTNSAPSMGPQKKTCTFSSSWGLRVGKGRQELWPDAGTNILSAAFTSIRLDTVVVGDLTTRNVGGLHTWRGARATKAGSRIYQSVERMLEAIARRTGGVKAFNGGERNSWEPPNTRRASSRRPSLSEVGFPTVGLRWYIRGRSIARSSVATQHTRDLLKEFDRRLSDIPLGSPQRVDVRLLSQNLAPNEDGAFWNARRILYVEALARLAARGLICTARECDNSLRNKQGLRERYRLSKTGRYESVSIALEISPRHDWPAFGMTGGNSDGRKVESWRHTHAGDMFVATVPRRLLEYDIPADTPLVVFARAFWGSWPLMIEKRIVHILARFGVLFQTRGGHVGAEGQHSFVETARILGGLFVVEAHEAPLGPLVTSWWLRPSEGFPKPGRVGILGGYHSFVVEDRPQIGNEPEPTVHLRRTLYPNPYQREISKACRCGKRSSCTFIYYIRAFCSI
ncbi:hypothetical protein B0H14DRAFT_3165865 [Mycena olivaceomarginata]|nr:hypothetical protein B0H14DRAFT_3165865 [Mycena olivaceomarginata]